MMWKRIFELLFGSEESDLSRHQSWLLLELLSEHFAVVRVSVAANLLNALVIIGLFWKSVPHITLLLGGMLLIAVLGHRFAIVSAFRKLPEGDLAGLQNIRKKVLVNATALGGWWGSTVCLLTQYATAQESLFLMVLGAGMMASGAITYRTCKNAARIFILAVATGSAFMLVTIGHAAALASLLLLFSFAVILLTNVNNTFANSVSRLQDNRQLAQSTETINMLLSDVTEQGSEWLLELDQDYKLVHPSSRVSEALGVPLDSLNNIALLALLKEGPEKMALLDHLHNRRAFRNQPVSVIHSQAETWWSISARPTNNEEVAYRGVVTDITAQRLAEQQVSYMAHFDALTGLPNRFQFQHQLSQMTGMDGRLTLMYLDLDAFKAVNDSLGHAAGDQLLKQVAERIRSCLDDNEFVARLGGDEFAIILPDNDKTRVKLLSTDLIQSFAIPFNLDGQDAFVGTSIGTAFAPQHGRDAATLLSNADLALYDAKAQGRNCCVQFEPGMDIAAQERRILERDLKNALGQNELCLYYQPLVDIETGGVNGYEALIRWNHPYKGMVMPNDFIPIAEDTGLIVPIGEWVIRKAIEDMQAWPDHLTIAINLSAVQLRSPSLMSTLIFALAKAQVDPARVCLEITESVLMQDSESNIELLHKIRDMGLQIALDDFGTGYSSLNYLRSFPFNKIKIDRCFVDEIDQSEESRAIVRSVVGLANSLGMQITAEGVERTGQANRLRGEGCTEAQGWLYAKALPQEQLPMMIPHQTVSKENLPTLTRKEYPALSRNDEPLRKAG